MSNSHARHICVPENLIQRSIFFFFGILHSFLFHMTRWWPKFKRGSTTRRHTSLLRSRLFFRKKPPQVDTGNRLKYTIKWLLGFWVNSLLIVNLSTRILQVQAESFFFFCSSSVMLRGPPGFGHCWYWEARLIMQGLYFLQGSHGLSTQRAQRTKSRGPKSLHVEERAWSCRAQDF